MILSAGDKGKRFMTTHATAMLHQPKVPSTGQRQAIELHIQGKEVLEQKKAMVDILSQTTGHSKEKIDKVRNPSPEIRVICSHVTIRPHSVTLTICLARM